MAGLGLVALVVALTSCVGPGPAADPGVGRADAVSAAAAIATQAPAGEPAPDPTIAVVPPAGTVLVQDGPFTDRLRIDDLNLTDHAVTGHLDVVSDPSEVINLEIRVDFYDAAGSLVGRGRQVFATDDTEAFHTTAGVAGLPFTVLAPARAHSAILTVPVLVNE